MGRNHIFIKIKYIIFCIALLAVPEVMAQLLENLETGSARAFALANAVTADPPGIDSIHFNPAGLSRLPDVGRLIELHMIAAAASVDFHKRKVADDDLFKTDINFDGCDNHCFVNGESEDPAGDINLRPNEILVSLPKFGVIKFDHGSGYTPVVVPRAGVAIRNPGSKFTFANSFYAELMGGLNFDTSDRGDYGGVNFLSITFFNYFTPTISYEINNKWSIGVGMGFIGSRWDVDADIRLPHPLVGALGKALDGICSSAGEEPDFCADFESEGTVLDPWKNLIRLEAELEDSFTPNYKIGLLWQPVPWFSWGAMYRTKTHAESEGTVTLTYNDTLASIVNEPVFSLLGRNTGKGKNYDKIKSKLHVGPPAQVATGISLQVFPDLKLNVDYRKTYYSDWQEWELELSKESWLGNILDKTIGSNVLPLPMAFKDTESIAYGVEYRFNDRWTFRFGYEERPTSSTGGFRAITPIPGAALDLKTFGGQYLFDQDNVIDFAFSFIELDEWVNRREDDLIQLAPGHDVRWDAKVIMTQFTWRKNY
ncbi:MAG: outer membrane protein transport protein [Pseudomonadales bacterium]|nr:outer membrane protein transport protein [Pseudomonadales bacterium]